MLNLLPYLLGPFAALPGFLYMICCAFYALLTKTHVEIMLDTVAASRDLVPDTFGMALVKRLDEVCTMLQLALTYQMRMHNRCSVSTLHCL